MTQKLGFAVEDETACVYVNADRSTGSTQKELKIASTEHDVDMHCAAERDELPCTGRGGTCCLCVAYRCAQAHEDLTLHSVQPSSKTP
mmetsp:Transcript_31538/g.71998  ORF Transcript_31538/g.71998 Transcript_31538/m.71998 type:complete len:88 (+) Transcript_31538:75-338(+)